MTYSPFPIGSSSNISIRFDVGNCFNARDGAQVCAALRMCLHGLHYVLWRPSEQQKRHCGERLEERVIEDPLLCNVCQVECSAHEWEDVSPQHCAQQGVSPQHCAQQGVPSQHTRAGCWGVGVCSCCIVVLQFSTKKSDDALHIPRFDEMRKVQR